MQCRWQVEIDNYATRVLERHWPNVRRWADVKTFPPDYSNDWHVDLICGGFPCQDISYAGRGAGLDGERSGLFFEAIRVVRELRPKYVLLENVAALLTRGLDRVLGELAQIGYDAEWDVLSACQFGYPHARERLFCVAYHNCCELRTSGPAKNQARAADVFISRIGEIAPLESRRSIISNVDSAFYGVPGVVDRLRGFGNAVVPDIAEYIGRQIVRYDSES